MTSKFRFIDLFAGIGGTRLAFESAGGECVFTSEWDRFAQETYRNNFGDEHEIFGDISQIDEKTVPKHKLISSHTARKTFITSSLVLGMSEVAVKKISNHKKDEHFRKYVNVAQSYINDEMDKGWGKFEVKNKNV